MTYHLPDVAVVAVDVLNLAVPKERRLSLHPPSCAPFIYPNLYLYR
jgi:hypothetical protein